MTMTISLSSKKLATESMSWIWNDYDPFSFLLSLSPILNFKQQLFLGGSGGPCQPCDHLQRAKPQGQSPVKIYHCISTIHKEKEPSLHKATLNRPDIAICHDFPLFWPCNSHKRYFARWAWTWRGCWPVWWVTPRTSSSTSTSSLMRRPDPG